MLPIAANYWTRTGVSGDWSTVTNWSRGSAPASDEHVIFNGLFSYADCTADLKTEITTTLSHVTMENGYSADLILSRADTDGPGTLTVTGNITITSGDIVCIGNQSATNAAAGGSAGDPYGEGIVLKASTITVAQYASINADRQGFDPSTGPGVSTNGGASYAGQGVPYKSYLNTNRVTGVIAAWGNASGPTALGSSGLSYATGGGAIKLMATNTVTINGTVSVLGEPELYGSSAGSIWVIANTLAGSGEMLAYGARGSRGSGSGGRVDLSGVTNFGFSGNIKPGRTVPPLAWAAAACCSRHIR